MQEKESVFFKSVIRSFSMMYKQLNQKKQSLENNPFYKSNSVSISMMQIGTKHILGIGIISDLTEYIEDDLHTFDFTLGIESLSENKWELNLFIGWASFKQGHITAFSDSFEYDIVGNIVDDIEVKFSEFYQKYERISENPISFYQKYI